MTHRQNGPFLMTFCKIPQNYVTSDLYNNFCLYVCELQRMLQSLSQSMELSDEVAYLVDYVWREAMGTLSVILKVPVRSVSLEKVNIYLVCYVWTKLGEDSEFSCRCM